MSAEPVREKPGSDAARALGCRCPVLDNNRGAWPPMPPDGWWINDQCSYHAAAWRLGERQAEQEQARRAERVDREQAERDRRRGR